MGGTQSIFDKTDVSIVVDADGLNWLSKQDDWWTMVPEHRLVLTPHPTEANRLSGMEVDDIVADPAGTAAELASKWKQTVVIKTGYTAVSNGTNTVVADLAPTSLATAGTGDCFAGAIGAYLSQGCSPLDAATLAIGVGSRAATALEETWGAAGVLAADLPDAMARAVHALTR
jgi:NAD(P)H-hydrate repair Nnr-like enzyme with NAD(P)H-hydrate dehydratase domain